MTVHGGDVWQVAAEAGVAVEDLLDFSSNINPKGLPPKAALRLVESASDSRLLASYPDPAAGAFRAALSEHLCVPAGTIVVGPGAEALLAPILRAYGARRALVPIPAFSEYRRVCAQQETEYVPFPLHRDGCFRLPVEDFCRFVATSHFDAIFVNNPHNPSGALLDGDEVRRIVRAAKQAGAMAVVDEAFIDYAADASVVSDAAAESGLVVVRSLTKFYGCPALRIGYAVTHPEMAQRIRSFLPAWPVTQVAFDGLSAAITDQRYAGATIAENAVEREWLSDALVARGMTVFPSAANYVLIELPAGVPESSELRRYLIAQHRILIRNCDSYEGIAKGRYIRLAVRSRSENIRLVMALDAFNAQGVRSTNSIDVSARRSF